MKDLIVRIVKGLLADALDVFTEKVLRRMTYGGALMSAGCGVAEGADRLVSPVMTPDVLIGQLTWTQVGILFGMLIGLSGLLMQALFGYLKRREESAMALARRAEESELHTLAIQNAQLEMQYARQRLMAKQNQESA
jgi:hypothetical protein